jgi:hypothetical protein
VRKWCRASGTVRSEKSLEEEVPQSKSHRATKSYRTYNTPEKPTGEKRLSGRRV